MEKDLQLQLHASGYLIVLENKVPNLGYANENEATTVTIILPSNAYGAHHFIELENPSGIPWSSAPLEEQVQDGVHFITLPLVDSVIPKSGRYTLQYVGRKGNQDPKVIRSHELPLDVLSSISAGIRIAKSNPDFITWATSQIAEIKLQQEAVDIIIPEVLERLDALETIIGQSVYMGVIFYGTETVGERLGAAVGKRAGVNGAPNDFDGLPIYKDIHTYFNENGEKIWAIEKPFYYKHVKHGNPGDDDFYEAHYISPTKLDDTWGLHIAFLDKNKNNRGRFTLGAYKASINEDNSKLVTKSGKPIKTSISLEDARILAANNNAHVAELRKANAVNILMMIEFAVRDFQRELFTGVTIGSDFYPKDTGDFQEANPSNIIRLGIDNVLEWNEEIFDYDIEKLKAYFAEGNAFNIIDDNEGEPLGEPDRIITSQKIVQLYDPDKDDTVDVLELTHTGSPVDWNAQEQYPYLYVTSITTGQCDGLEGSSHERVDQPYGLRHFSYRGLEDFWGVFYEWTDGVALKIYATNVTQNQKTHYTECFDPEFYHESDYNNGNDRVMSHFEEVALLTHSSGYLEAFKELPQYPGVLVPSNAGGSDSTYYADYNGVAQSNNSASPAKTYAYVFYRGGYYYNWFHAGPLYVYGSYSDNSDRIIGLRLSYDPS